MEVPEETKKSLAYQCAQAINLSNKFDDVLDIIEHYKEKGHILDHIAHKKTGRMGLMFADGSLIVIIRHESNDIAILAPSMVLRALLTYFPFEKLGKVKAV